MIQINDYDMPINVAEKIISGTREVELTPLMKTLRKGLAGEEVGDESTEDMFDLEEIKEIADYLLVYYNSHLQGD